VGKQLAARERGTGNEAAARFDEQADQAARYADLILEHVLHASRERAGEIWSKPRRPRPYHPWAETVRRSSPTA
jgi:hypothetical protein